MVHPGAMVRQCEVNMESRLIMESLAALAHGAWLTGRVELYRECESLAFQWLAEEDEDWRWILIDMFPWGLDLE
jgi:hypothetical protein